MSLVRVLFFLSGAALLSAADFIAPDALDVRQVVPPPPAAGSINEEADEISVVLFERDRTPEQVALARNWEKYDAFKLLQPVLGAWADEHTLPKFAAFIKASGVETIPFTNTLKKTYTRPRPHVVNPALQPVLAKPESSSYPSGHATASALHATILATILPEYAAQFAHQAELARLSRLYAGVHFPSDIAAGRRLGEAIAREMLKSPATQRAIEEIRTEMRAALAAHRKAA